MITEVKDFLISNNELSELIGNRIAGYNYEEERDHDKPFVVITPINPPKPGVAGSDTFLNVEFTYQINVEGKDRKTVKRIATIIREQMFLLGFTQLSGGLDEYFVDTQRFVDARRFRGKSKIYHTNY